MAIGWQIATAANNDNKPIAFFTSPPLRGAIGLSELEEGVVANTGCSPLPR
jgi:hypothetical protein